MNKRVLITGAGGPSAISFMQAISDLGFEIVMADMDSYAAGLYLTQGVLLPRADEPTFIPVLLEIIKNWKIDILVPTVDAELAIINQCRNQFNNVLLAMSPLHVLNNCLDKWELCKILQDTDLIPQSSINANQWDVFPALIKPRKASGGRGVIKVKTKDELERMFNQGDIIQEYLPGREFSVDIYINKKGKVIGCVPRERLKIDSGIAVTARTLHYPLLEKRAREIAQKINLIGLANVQFKEDIAGLPRLMEINARCPGTMPLTVKSGVNMPKLLILELLGEEINQEMDFKEIAMVRHWTEVYLDSEQSKRFDDG